MTRLISILIFSIALSGFSLAGGNTSVVNLTEVHSVVVEKDKVTIVGSGFVVFRAMTTKEHQTGKDQVFGQPAQTVHMRVDRGTFTIIPYASNPDIKGVSTGGHSSEEMKKLSKKWWIEMIADYKKIKIGDSITIGYQRDVMVTTGFKVKSMIGSGGVSIHTPKE